MVDRRTDDRQVAPRRSLTAPASGATAQAEPRPAVAEVGQPFAERVSSAVSTASSAVSSAVRRPSSSAQTGATSVSSRPARPRGPRKARLRLTHVDPWSVMKTAFLLSIALGIVIVVAVAVVWSVLGAAGVWDSINRTVADVVGGDTAQTFDVQNYVGTSRVLGFAMIVAVADVVLMTAVATLGAFLYNLAAALLGGIELTLAEDEH